MGRNSKRTRHPVILSERGWVGGSGVEAKDLALFILNAASNDSKLSNKLRSGPAGALTYHHSPPDSFAAEAVRFDDVVSLRMTHADHRFEVF